VKTAVQTCPELESAIADIGADKATGLIVLPENFISANAHVIAALALRHGLPAVSPFRFFPAYGGLMSYRVDPIEIIEARLLMSTVSSEGSGPAICRCSCQTNSRWSSTPRRRKRSGSQCRRRCSHSPTK
jgi:hypothetical protein